MVMLDRSRAILLQVLLNVNRFGHGCTKSNLVHIANNDGTLATSHERQDLLQLAGASLSSQSRSVAQHRAHLSTDRRCGQNRLYDTITFGTGARVEVEGHIRCAHTAPLLTLPIRDLAKDMAIIFENLSTEVNTTLSGFVTREC